MVLFNYSTRELTAKIVYYGPGICGKTTNLQFIHENLPDSIRGKMLSLATKTDRTLFFDFLPIDLGEIRGLKTRVQLYTVPGQVFYNETRKLVLKGVDGIVFVADSQETMLGANVESFKNLEENLKANGMKLAEMPHVIQFNKRDLPRLSGVEDLNAALNKFNAPFYESVATSGIGVQDTLKAIVKLVLLHLTRKYDPKSVPVPVIAAAPPAVVEMASIAASAGAPIRVAAPASSAPPTERPHVPLSPVHAPTGSGRMSAPPPPEVRKNVPRAIEAMSPFGEDEIDGLVDEVEEIDAPSAAVPVDEGAWLGAPEDDERDAVAIDAATYGSNVSLEDLLAEDAPAARASTPQAPTAHAGASEWQATSAAESEFEVDRGFDPDWSSFEPSPTQSADASPPADEPFSARSEELLPIAPFPLPVPESAHEASPESGVLLTEVASDEDLFSDPSLEIAHLADGQAQEIIVPVMLGEGRAARRYKLAIRLRFDPVE